MIALIQKVLNVAWDQWEYRNAILHIEWEDEDLQGIAFVNEEIKRELTLRPVDIPQWKHFYFQVS